jgi:D-tyrosyl-tRNA(Tyr) deacylase
MMIPSEAYSRLYRRWRAGYKPRGRAAFRRRPHSRMFRGIEPGVAMRAVVQRVKEAKVTVDGEDVGAVGPGLLVFLGVAETDADADLDYMLKKIPELRIFEDDEGKMNRSLVESGGAMLVVSQFTLYGDCRKGRRPGFSDAARPEKAIPMYERFIAGCREAGLVVETGRFGAMMDVELVNDGPVTLLLDSTKAF